MSKFFARSILVFFLVVSIAPFSFSQEKIVLSLQKSLETAYQNNRSLRSQKEKINSAKFKIQEAKSGFYPNLSFQGSFTYLGVNPSFVVDIPGVFNQQVTIGFHDNYTFALALQQSLFTWGRIGNRYSISNLNLSLEQENYIKNKQGITFNVTSGFYSALLDRELINVRQDALNNFQEHLKSLFNFHL